MSTETTTSSSDRPAASCGARVCTADATVGPHKHLRDQTVLTGHDARCEATWLNGRRTACACSARANGGPTRESEAEHAALCDADEAAVRAMARIIDPDAFVGPSREHGAVAHAEWLAGQGAEDRARALAAATRVLMASDTNGANPILSDALAHGGAPERGGWANITLATQQAIARDEYPHASPGQIVQAGVVLGALTAAERAVAEERDVAYHANHRALMAEEDAQHQRARVRRLLRVLRARPLGRRAAPPAAPPAPAWDPQPGDLVVLVCESMFLHEEVGAVPGTVGRITARSDEHGVPEHRGALVDWGAPDGRVIRSNLHELAPAGPGARVRDANWPTEFHLGSGQRVTVRRGDHLLVQHPGTGDPVCACGQYDPARDPAVRSLMQAPGAVERHVTTERTRTR